MLLVDLSGRNWRVVNSRRHFERLRAARVRGALVKATEGATFVNERYRAYRRWALDVGMLVHPYVVPAPWTEVVLHQYTSRGRIGGIYPLDLDYTDKLQGLLAFPPV
jgi:GH25 family lysozyme M1 (1,4-beta-N-acetylmuramidase)